MKEDESVWKVWKRKEEDEKGWNKLNLLKRINLDDKEWKRMRQNERGW